jgi:fatty-acyl-CoA synthase
MTVVSPNPFLDSTAGQMLATVAARFPEREAIVAADRRFTYADFRRETTRVARGLLAFGVGKNDKVAIWLPNRPEWLFLQYACALIGAVAVALNPRYKSHELSYILRQSDATTLVLADHLGPVDYLETLQEVVPLLAQGEPGDLQVADFPFLRRVIVDAEDPYPGCLGLRDVTGAGESPEWEHALAEAARTLHPDDPFTILYTSGTTSFPKGAVMTHRNAVPHGWFVGEALRVTETDRVLHALPLSGTWGGLCIPLSTLSHGGCLVLMETFEPGVALYLMEQERITVWNAVDAMAIAVLDHPDLGRRRRDRLRTGGIGMTGGGRHGLFEEVVERLGLREAYQPYGMTELNALCLLHRLDEPVATRARSGAWPAEATEVRVVDPDTGIDAPIGQEGELWFRGRVVTPGYYGKPEETARAFTPDGWFRTGDLGVRDAEGRTFFRSRLREVLRISHFMVSPAEIEAYLQTHPGVHQAFVIGVPDPRTNEAAVAYVIPKPGSDLRAEELIAHCKGRIASYKVPRAVRIVDDVPRTPGPHGDKVQKGKLRELYLGEGSRVS